ncbi:NACHT domain-containing protein [Pseudanabaena yagii]|uniref:NACHT domain-containing protein n=1 Tax=Pseudanabaena yagii GIHE-NHR1 TaxID=2722753 RepID=A0ABX1LWP9_9CYAN|nr:NACHT domain-containing protein [Pseudanabaena yagii]NMF60622.1 NACHT domain-containing protein [Pseudanabaena yagii GIHE-NHR1]
MSDQSLIATKAGINLAKNALTGKKLTQEKLMELVDVQSRSTISNFFTGKPVDRQIFVTICENLEINWQEVSGRLSSQSKKSAAKESIDIESLVQLARKQCAADILKRCGTMQILTMPQEIGLGEIYTDVKLFDRVLGKRFLTEKEYLAELDPTDWEQTGFAGLELRKDRLDGLEVVSQFLRLMVLGRPGAGKTTFLKHLAILCNSEKFEPERVPIFVTLQDYARNEESLESFIRRKWNEDCGISDPLVLKDILESGQALILLDGLDEVIESRRLAVIRAIENLAGAYDQARIVVTCRIAAKEYIFPKFREVQVAEFDKWQIQSFVSKWFEQDKERISKFFAKLEERPRIKHQASNPLLLTFLCLIFEDRNDFYENRALLYEKGIDLLMERWDSSREKERDAVYKGLSTQRKEEMLSLLAFETFQEELLLFSRDRAANSIATYIKDLSTGQKVAKVGREGFYKR